MLFVGIDPGLDGAVAFVDEAGVLLDVFDAPTLQAGKRRKPDLRAMKDILAHTAITAGGAMRAQAALEKIHSMPGQGVAAMFSMGYGLAAWEMGLVGAGLPYSLVTPQAWRGLLLAGFPPPEDKKQRKVQAVQRCEQLWPAQAGRFRGPKGGMLDGRADAALMAEYVRLTRQ